MFMHVYICVYIRRQNKVESLFLSVKYIVKMHCIIIVVSFTSRLLKILKNKLCLSLYSINEPPSKKKTL